MSRSYTTRIPIFAHPATILWTAPQGRAQDPARRPGTRPRLRPDGPRARHVMLLGAAVFAGLVLAVSARASVIGPEEEPDPVAEIPVDPCGGPVVHKPAQTS